jgi:hypothetical protein
MASAILTHNATQASSFNMTKIIGALEEGNVVILHSNYKCAHIFHKCGTLNEGKQKETQNEFNGLVSKEITVFYMNVDQASLLRTGGWVDSLETEECDCSIDATIRKIWWGPASNRFI